MPPAPPPPLPPGFEDRLALALDPGAGPDLRLAAAGFLAGEGLFAEMAGVAEALRAVPAAARDAQRLALACRQFARWGLHERLEPWVDPLTGDAARAARTRSAMWLRRGAGREAVIVFVGTASQYWVTLYMLERFLPPDRHILFLKDPDRLSFAFGCPALGPRHTDIAPALERFRAGLGTGGFHTVGTSSGGFAALHLALSAGARGALALSPETTLAGLAEQVLGAATPEQAAALLPRMPVPLDLAWLLSRPGAASPPLLLVHAAGHAADAAACARLAGLPGVAVEAVPGCDAHDTLGPLIARGDIGRVFARLFGAA